MIPLAKLVEEVKSHSSKWIKTKGTAYQNFYWQNGYGAFSVSYYHTEKISSYIANQHVHHRKKDFPNEYLDLLKKHKAEYDERYLWD